jgi:hypothetical protein
MGRAGYGVAARPLCRVPMVLAAATRATPFGLAIETRGPRGGAGTRNARQPDCGGEHPGDARILQIWRALTRDG